MEVSDFIKRYLNLHKLLNEDSGVERDAIYGGALGLSLREVAEGGGWYGGDLASMDDVALGENWTGEDQFWYEVGAYLAGRSDSLPRAEFCWDVVVR